MTKRDEEKRAWEVLEATLWPTSAWKTCMDCGLSDWHQAFETLIDHINKCPRCGSRRLRTEIKRRKP